MPLSIERLGGTFVAELRGLDLGRELDDETWASIHHAYLEHKVLSPVW